MEESMSRGKWKTWQFFTKLDHAARLNAALALCHAQTQKKKTIITHMQEKFKKDLFELRTDGFFFSGWKRNHTQGRDSTAVNKHSYARADYQCFYHQRYSSFHTCIDKGAFHHTKPPRSNLSKQTVVSCQRFAGRMRTLSHSWRSISIPLQMRCIFPHVCVFIFSFKLTPAKGHLLCQRSRSASITYPPC